MPGPRAATSAACSSRSLASTWGLFYVGWGGGMAHGSLSQAGLRAGWGLGPACFNCACCRGSRAGHAAKDPAMAHSTAKHATVRTGSGDKQSTTQAAPPPCRAHLQARNHVRERGAGRVVARQHQQHQVVPQLGVSQPARAAASGRERDVTPCRAPCAYTSGA